jgi:hypothetical protein
MVSFKVFTKVGTNIIIGIVYTVIKPAQSTFMPEQYILEGVVVLHDTICELQRKKMDGVLFKIDSEKGYNKVQWTFLQQTMSMKGFSPKWCELVDSYVRRGSVRIKVNDHISSYF